MLTHYSGKNSETPQIFGVECLESTEPISKSKFDHSNNRSRLQEITYYISLQDYHTIT